VIGRKGASRAALACAAVLVAAVVSVSSGQAARSAAIPLLRVGTSLIYSTLDPANTQGCNADYCDLIYDHLMRFSAAGKLEPDLAQSVTHPGAAIYIYHLRHGAKFWDGNEVTADDVANALNYQRFPKFESSVSFVSVKSVTAQGRYTVVITLKHADPSFPYVMGYEGPIFEKKFQQAHGSDFGKPGVGTMATGPWKVASFDPSTGMELTANPSWWDGAVNVQHVSIKVFSSDTSAALAMRAGQLDVYFPQDGRAFGSTSGAKIIAVPASYIEAYFGMNYHVGPWSNVHVRRAAAYAINRQDLISALGGDASPVTTLIPPGQLLTLGSKAQVDALIKSLPSYPFSITKAKAELAQSPYPQGFTAANDCANFGNFPELCQVIAGDLAKIGIKLQINVEDVGKWISEVYGPKTYTTMFTTYGWPNPDPSGYPSQILGSKATRPGGANFANYDPPAVDALIKESTSIANPKKRLAIYGQLLRRLATDEPYMPLYLANYDLALGKGFSWPGFNELSVLGPWAQYIKSS
jgi:peptide/nickel transport system substrate-binding protein